MFYNCDLMTQGVFRSSWLTGNNLESGDQAEEEDLANICNEVSGRLAYTAARHRLSLRACAVLLSGTARLYRQQLDTLYSDCVELDLLMIGRGRGRADDDQASSHDGVESEHTGEESVERNNSENLDKSPNNISAGSENTSKSISCRAHSNSNCYNTSRRRSRVERGTQTSRSSIRRVSLDQTLPVGVTTVYDGPSRTPVGVICGNINPDIRRLYRNL